MTIENFLNLEGYEKTRKDRRKNNKEILEMNNGKKFDIILMNPPFEGELHLKFLEKSLNISNKLVIVEPSTWLINLKNRKKLDNLYQIINKHTKSIELHNYSKDFNIGIFVPCSISAFDLTKEYNSIEFNNHNNISKVKSIYDCNLIGNYELINNILNKVNKYPYKFKDHIYNKTSEIDENTYFTKFKGSQLGGGGLIVAPNKNGGNISIKADSCFVKTNVGEFRKQYIDCLISPKYNSISDKVLKTIDAGKHETNKDADCLFDTKEHLENWKYNVYNIKLLIFISILFTINNSNNIKNILPWLVDKQYTDSEINKLFNFNDDEINLIDNTINKYDRNSKWFKAYMTGEEE